MELITIQMPKKLIDFLQELAQKNGVTLDEQIEQNEWAWYRLYKDEAGLIYD